MYIHRYLGFVYKSIDGGTTWNSLPNSPTFTATPIRMRCSADGSVIAGIDFDGLFNVSKNGGTTWFGTNFPALGGFFSIDSADFGMPIDGSKFLVAMRGDTVAAISWTSNDGINWKDHTVKLPSARKDFTQSGRAPVQCAVSPNGDKAVVIYRILQNLGDTTFGTDASYNGNWHNPHGTWIHQPITANLTTASNTVAAAMLPV